LRGPGEAEGFVGRWAQMGSSGSWEGVGDGDGDGDGDEVRLKVSGRKI
jgi:hypothetical protein